MIGALHDNRILFLGMRPRQSKRQVVGPAAAADKKENTQRFWQQLDEPERILDDIII